jgi:hypothetical protein
MSRIKDVIGYVQDLTDQYRTRIDYLCLDCMRETPAPTFKPIEGFVYPRKEEIGPNRCNRCDRVLGIVFQERRADRLKLLAPGDLLGYENRHGAPRCLICAGEGLPWEYRRPIHPPQLLNERIPRWPECTRCHSDFVVVFEKLRQVQAELDNGQRPMCFVPALPHPISEQLGRTVHYGGDHNCCLECVAAKFKTPHPWLKPMFEKYLDRHGRISVDGRSLLPCDYCSRRCFDVFDAMLAGKIAPRPPVQPRPVWVNLLIWGFIAYLVVVGWAFIELFSGRSHNQPMRHPDEFYDHWVPGVPPSDQF